MITRSHLFRFLLATPLVLACGDSGGLGPDIVPDELIEDRSVYDQDDLALRRIELTVTDLDGLAAVRNDEPDASVTVLMREGDFRGGGTMRVRGHSSREAAQKSFRIKLESATELWRGHRTIHLNKHPWDLTRVRNKLSFDLFRRIRHMTSLRTSFVELVINGESLGLFTQIENPDRHFLARHGLDPEGQLYKAEDFMFEPIDDEVWADEDELAEILEVKANPDHAKLREMLDAVNDNSRDINEVIATYFQRDNYLTWLAVNIVMGNFDTIEQNYFLYSPAGSRRWYFLPWDYDDTWGFVTQHDIHLARGRATEGVANWWFPVLHARFLRDPGNVADLTARVRELHESVLHEAAVSDLLTRYRDVVRPLVTRAPDVDHLPVASDVIDPIPLHDAEYQRIAGMASVFHADYLDALDRPMPVFLDEPEIVDGVVELFWSESFDLQGDPFTYELQIHTDPDFPADSVLVLESGLTEPYAEVALGSGTYWARVIIREPASTGGEYQECANFYYDEAAESWYACALRFEVAP